MLSGYLPQLLSGLLITIEIAFTSVVIGLLIGIIGAAGESSKNKWINRFFIGFHSIIRGVPELLVVFFIYFGLTALLSAVFKTTIQVNAFVAGTIALSLLFGAYASQTLRGAFMAIPKGQWEAAHALGMSRWQSFRFILAPQAWQFALPGLGNLWLVLLKDTALVSLIGLTDLMSKSQIAAISTAKPFTFYATAAILYLLLTSASEVLLQFLGRDTRK